MRLDWLGARQWWAQVGMFVPYVGMVGRIVLRVCCIGWYVPHVELSVTEQISPTVRTPAKRMAGVLVRPRSGN